jgi:hypothetical protein
MIKKAAPRPLRSRWRLFRRGPRDIDGNIAFVVAADDISPSRPAFVAVGAPLEIHLANGLKVAQ